jgi:hypothetical protein
MPNSKKATALAGVLGGLALAGAGFAHAAAADPAGPQDPPEQPRVPRVQCTHDVHGNVECSRHIDRTWTSEDGSRITVHQTRDCDSYSRNRRIGPPLRVDRGRI